MVSNFLVETIAQSSSNASVLISIFQACLIDESNIFRVAIAAIRSLSVLLVNLPQESDFEPFYCLTEVILQGLQATVRFMVADSTNVAAIAFTESLIDIAENTLFFTMQFGLVFEVVMNIMEQAAIVPALRHMLVEFLVCICVSSAKRARKLKSATGEKGYFASRFIPFCVRMMVTVTHDDPSWETVDTLEENADDGSTDFDVGEAALDRVTHCLGLRSTFPIMTTQLHLLLSSSAWQYHFAGLRSIATYLEVSAQIPEKAQLHHHREEISNIIMLYASNVHVRVRSAAFYAATQFFVMHGKTLKVGVIDKMLPMLLQSASISINPSPRVRRSAMLALVHLIDRAPASAIEKHTRSILDTIVTSLSEGSVLVQEQCVQGIVSVTENLSSDCIRPYYDSLMPILKQLLTYAQSHELESLWGQGLECCARLGEVSGKVKFYPDALEMMGTLVQVQTQLAESSDVRKYVMKAWVRIA